ncbi:MAG: tRNA-dihydrouridine synthase [Rickettsiales bacterium]|jgi:tRNA-dihydrouridine synthase B|nr:tRNA-dihydrouridine synthase [Rickettsiales bacterium]
MKNEKNILDLLVPGSRFLVPIIAAPMAGITDAPFRAILRRVAPHAPIMTEMISSHSLVENRKKTLKTNCNRNFDDYRKWGPVGAQIFGADPKIMADGAKILEQNGASWIDINMGCPVPKVATRAGAGAFLMLNHKLSGQIIENIVKSVNVPVSIKTRLGWDNTHLDSANLIKIAADSGASFATVHGRTRAAGYMGNADWSAIKKIADSSPIPIVFNGDIKTAEDIAAVQKMGAAGAMIGRAMMGNPWAINNFEIPDDKLELILEHLDLTLSYYSEKPGIMLFRKHAAWYASGRPNANEFRASVNQITTAADMRSAIIDFFTNRV